MRSSTCGQIDGTTGTGGASDASGSPVPSQRGGAAAGGWARAAARSVMSGTGTTTFRSHRFSDGGCTISTGRPPARNRPTSSTGRTVADSPMR